MKIEAYLEGHQATDAKELADVAEMLRFARDLAEPFSRQQWPAHFTGSALVVDEEGERVCLVLHKKLHRWLQPGGHCEAADGGDMAASALREAREETGLQVSLHPTAPRPFDVDIHTIPARKDEPQHAHLDVRFLVVASNPEALTFDANESSGACWLSWEEAFAREPELGRLISKARALLTPRAESLSIATRES